MLYYIVKYLSRVGFRIYFRKINFYQQEAFPKKKPIIFAVNHPTAFLDPVIVGTFIWPPVHFIVRGDIFNNRLIRAILAALKMYPIFRFRDGYSNLKNNQQTLELMDKKLSEGKNILILAEGETKHEKRMRPIQKGAARMAFGAIDKHGELDIQVVPVGVNYTDAHKFRSEVMVEFGKAIPLSNYLELHRENPRKAIKKLTDDIAAAMRKRIIHINNRKDDEWVNALLDFIRHDHLQALLPALNHDPQQLHREYALVEKINQMEVEEKTASKGKVLTYQEMLKTHGLQDIGIALRKKTGFTTFLLLMLGFPVFLVGYLLNFLPLYGAVKLADKKVKKIEFHASVRYGAGLVFYLLYWLIFWIVALIVGKNWFFITVAIIPVLGYFALLYRDVFLQWNEVRKFNQLSEEVKSDLLEKRKAITQPYQVSEV